MVIESIAVSQMATRVFRSDSAEELLRADVSGAPTSTLDALFGIGSVILGAVLIISFFLMADFARRKRRSDYIDMRPTPGRLLFDQTPSQLGGAASDRPD